MGQTFAYYEFTSTVDSDLLDVSKCRDVNVALYPSTTDSTTGATVYIKRCSASADSTTVCKKVIPTPGGVANDTPLTGDPAAQLQGFQNLQAGWIYVNVTGATAGKTARVLVDCH